MDKGILIKRRGSQRIPFKSKTFKCKGTKELMKNEKRTFHLFSGVAAEFLTVLQNKQLQCFDACTDRGVGIVGFLLV